MAYMFKGREYIAIGAGSNVVAFCLSQGFH